MPKKCRSKRRSRMPRVPKGKYDVAGILKLAKRKGIELKRTQIGEKLRRIRTGKEPWPEGLKEIGTGQRHIFHFPQQFVNELFAEERHKRTLTRHLEAGRVLPLKQLASDLGLRNEALYRYKSQGKLDNFMVKGLRYVTRREAERFEQWYSKEVAGTKSSRGGKLHLATAEEKRKMIIRDHETRQQAEFYLKHMIPRVTNKKKQEFMRELILKNRHLPPDIFNKRIIGKIDDMLAVIHKWKKEDKGKE